MRKKNELKLTTNDPLELLLGEFIHNFVKKESEDVAHDAVAEMTDLYIVESQFITFYRRKLLKERIDQVMKEAVDDLLCEYFVNAAIEKILNELAEPLVLLCCEEEFFEKESEEIEKGFDDLVMRNIMETIMENINERLADKNLEFIADQATMYNKYKDFSEEFLNEVIMFDDK